MVPVNKIEMLKSKLHKARVTDGDVDYEGSLGIDSELMEAVGFYPYEKILVANINNGARFETYVIPMPYGSRQMVVNGAAARLAAVNDRIIIMSFAWVEESEVRDGRYRPRVLRLTERNEPEEMLCQPEGADESLSMIEG